jgi:hypothetical protein
MQETRSTAMDAGLKYGYLGDVPGSDTASPRCPREGRIPGVWS